MNKGFIGIFSFMVGAAAGSILTWKFIKSKYEQLAREEIEEVREYYATKDNIIPSSDKDDETVVETVDEVPTEPTETNIRMDYAAIASVYAKNDEGGDEPMSRREPYVISPAELGEDDNYETVTLIYYNDGILADNDGNIIEDIESCIGYESLNHFGEYEDDSVCVRNDDSMTDYEVLLDMSNYADRDGVN